MHAERLPSSVPELLEARAGSDPDGIASYHRMPGRGWIPTTWSQLGTEVRRLAVTFQRLGLDRGDRFAIIARTCREWQLVELAALATGSVIVGVDAHSAAEQVGSVMEHAEATAALVDTLDNARKIPPAVRRRLKFLIVLEEPDAAPDMIPWSACAAANAVAPSDERRLAPSAGDPATLIYTSGTTGAPKGIEYTHGQLMLACGAILQEFPDLRTSHTVLCWLPMAPLFQRMMNLVACASGATTYFVEDPRHVMECVREVKPSVFIAVPRFYEKLHQAIDDHVRKQRGWRRRLIELALMTGAQRSRRVRAGAKLPRRLALSHALLDRLVLRRMRDVMGGRIEWMISGSAPTAPWLLEYFHSMGLLVLEAYGLSENVVPVAANRPHAYRFGSVGRPFAMNEIRIAADGELLIRGPGVFRGYHRDGRPVEAFTADDYYRTGDYAHLDPDGYLFLVGREAEMIKTSTGHRVAPAAVEAVYRRSRYVDHVIVVGSNRKHLAALVTLNVPAVESELKGRGLATPGPQELATLPFVESLVRREIEECGSRLASYERVRAFAILPEPLTVEGGDLTTSLKLRRGHIERRYGPIIDRMYTIGLSATRTPGPATSIDAITPLKV